MQYVFFHLAGISITVSIVVMLLLLMLSYLDQRYTVKWRYFIWLILAIRLIIPIDFGLTAPPLEIHFNDREVNYSSERSRDPGNASATPEKPSGASNLWQALKTNKAGDQMNGETVRTAVRPDNHSGFLTVGRLVSWIWLSGVVLFLLWQIGLYLSFRFAIGRWYREVSCVEIREMLNRLKAEMGINNPIPIKVCKKIVSPMIAGLHHPVLLIPHEGYQKADLEVILKHELVHIRRNDLWYKLVLILANALHWFNPFLYIMVREANKDIEMSCDEEVLRGADLALRKRYSERILELMQVGCNPKAPVSTNFYGGKDMMKSRIRHIFDERVKKKGVAAFLVVLILILVFSACRLYEEQQWQIPITMKSADAYGWDQTGGRNSEMQDFEVSMPFDLDRNGAEDIAFSLAVSDQGRACSLKFKKSDENRTVITPIFQGIEPGVAYSLQAANLGGTDSIILIAAIDYRGMPFGSGYWELYSWNGYEFGKVNTKSIRENLQMMIMGPEESKKNPVNAQVEVYHFDKDQYPEDYPILGLYFQDEYLKEESGFGSISYLPLSEFDAEGYRIWGQDAVNKTMTGMKFVSGDSIQGRNGFDQALLETTEVVYMTLPNVTATIKRYYQYQDESWILVDGYIAGGE